MTRLIASEGLPSADRPRVCATTGASGTLPALTAPLRCRVLVPREDAALERSFHELSAACYARYGAAAAVTVPSARDEVCYFAVLSGEALVGGIRLHTRRADAPLPMETFFAGHARVRAALDARTPEGLAELAGLWSAPEVAGTGIGGAIVGTLVALAPSLGLRHLCSFAHQFNRFTERVGFQRDAAIGDHPYPDARYRSSVHWCEATGLPTADPDVRAHIQSLRRAFAEHTTQLGRSLPFDFDPRARLWPAPSPRRTMTSSVKTRSFRTSLDTRSTTLRLAPDCVLVETAETPDDARDLAARSPLGPAPAEAKRSTTLCLRNDAGELLATALVCSAANSPLKDSFPEGTLAKTHYLAALASTDGRERFLAPALYVAIRRARIDGSSTIAAHVARSAGLHERGLTFRPLAAGADAEGREARAERIDLAATLAYEAARRASGGDLSPEVFGAEVVETFERWLRDLYGRGFFKAVNEGTLGLEQYVYAISNMHQFVRWTTRLLGHAVAHAHDKELRDHFLLHLQGEVNHELILERDLRHLGEDVAFVVERMAASPGTRQFMAVQESLVGLHHELILFLASPLAAEGVASHLTPEFLARLEENIATWGIAEPKRAMTFFSSHVSTDGGDDGHWELVMSVAQRRLLSEGDVARFLGILRASTRALTTMYDEFVEDQALFANFRSR